MSKLQQAIYELNRVENLQQSCDLANRLDARGKLIVTLLYLVTMLSLPLTALSRLLLFGLYPLVMCTLGGFGFLSLLRRSLYVLPFIALIAIFNPLYNHETAFMVGRWSISQGWVSFFSIAVRGLLAVQAVMLLIYTTGFGPLCHAMQRMGLPSILSTQLLFVYRYMALLLQEALTMQRARRARSFGRKGLTPKMAGTLVGELLLRTVSRAEHIHCAMMARGFTGRINYLHTLRWHSRDTLFVCLCALLFALLRFLSLPIAPLL